MIISQSKVIQHKPHLPPPEVKLACHHRDAVARRLPRTQSHVPADPDVHRILRLHLSFFLLFCKTERVSEESFTAKRASIMGSLHRQCAKNPKMIIDVPPSRREDQIRKATRHMGWILTAQVIPQPAWFHQSSQPSFFLLFRVRLARQAGLSARYIDPSRIQANKSQQATHLAGSMGSASVRQGPH